MSNTATLLFEVASLQGAAFVCTVAMLLLGLVLLPREERGALKAPVLLLFAHILVALCSFSVKHGLPLRGATITMVTLLFAALARVSFLLIVDWLFGKVLRKRLPKIFRDIFQAVVFLAMAMLALHELGFELSSLLTTSAILTAVLGLSLQETLSNVFAGLAVQAERPFEVGDWVQFGENQTLIGQVVEINWRATKLRTHARNETIVPNGIIARSTIQNFGRPEPVTRSTVGFLAPYEVTPNEVERALEGCLGQFPGVSETPAPQLWTEGFADSGVSYQLVYFITDYGSRKSIESRVRNRIWYALERAGISIPYAPIRNPELARAGTPIRDPKLVWNQEAIAALLERVEFFDSLPEAVRRRLGELARVERYGRDEPIVAQGNAGSDLFVVATGEVSVVTVDSAGEQHHLATLGPSSLFGELSLITGTRSATVVSTVESVVVRVSHDAFRQALEEVPSLSESILALLTERCERLARNGDAPDAAASASVRQAFLSRLRCLFFAA
jgi:small-conductance mechanosensitive channel/CRP-like cAMP-binding protein